MKRSVSERDKPVSSTNKAEADVLARQRLIASRLSLGAPKPYAPEAKNNHVACSLQTVGAVVFPAAGTTNSTTTGQPAAAKAKVAVSRSTTIVEDDLQIATQKAVDAARARIGLQRAQPQNTTSTATTVQPQKTTSHTRPTSMKRTLLASLSHSSAGAAQHSNNAKQRYYNTVHVDDFWSNLRSWNFCQDLQQHLQQQQQQQHQHQQQQQQQPLPVTYDSYSHYVSAWAPLCLNEARAQLMSEIASDLQHQGQQKLFQFSVVGQPLRMDVGTHTDYVRLQFNVPIMETEQQGHLHNKGSRHVMANTNNNKVTFKPNDLVLIVKREQDLLQIVSSQKKQQSSSNSSSGSSCSAPSSSEKIIGILGTCDNFKSGTPEGLIVKVSRQLWTNKFSLSASTSDHCQQQHHEELCLIPLKAKNVTSFREFHALCNAKEIPLLPVLLAGNLQQQQQQQPVATVSSSNSNTITNKTKTELLQDMGGVNALGKGFAAYAERKFNESQLEAISAAAKDYGKGGFTLVKGPPGTGKTTTLAALVNALHIKQFNKYYEELRRMATTGNEKVSTSTTTFQEVSKHKPRILICAPSNAAVDNIIFKIMEDGFIDGNGCRYNPVMCRIGSGQSAAVGDVSLETKVMDTLAEGNDVVKIQQLTIVCQDEMTATRALIKKVQRRAIAILAASPWPLQKHFEIRLQEPFEQTNQVYFVNHKDKTTSTDLPPPPDSNQAQFPPSAMPEYRSYVSQLVKLIERNSNLSNKMERYKLITSCSSSSDRNSYATLRQQIETHIIDSVHIVLTTLGTAGSRALESAAKFGVVVVDEAAQSVEPATLPALQLGAAHAILVGDPQQLPATIFSVSGKTTKYDRSLFQRLEEAGHKVHMLNIQYRMHPDISDFPRRIFYGGNLVDGPNVVSPDYGNPLRQAVQTAFKSFRPFTILDLDSSEERGAGSTSLSNSTEANLALHLYQSLDKETAGAVFKTKVAVISPYAQQVSLLRKTFFAAFGAGYEERIEINTVDGFQGRESNIVIFSCVRAAGSKGIGFLSDVRRMNVALTRAKYFLFVIARCKSIVVNPYWRDLVKHAREKKSIIAIPLKSGKGQQSLPSLTNL